MSRSTASARAERTPATIRAGVQRVGYRMSLAQEFRVPGQLGPRSRGRQRSQPAGQRGRGADWRGGLARDQAGPRQQRGQGVHAGVELAEVRLGTAGPLWGAHAQEVDVAEPRRLGKRGGEPQPARPQASAEQRDRGRVRGTAPGRSSGPGSWRGRCPRPAPRSPVQPGRPRAPRRGSRCRSRSDGACHPASSRFSDGAVRYPVPATLIAPAGHVTPRFAADPAGQAVAPRQRAKRREVTRA